ncbi:MULTISPECIES: class I SAM-dependent methyltransferase [Acidobacteriaceae]|uniref:class I SAM-dependent methyltransferase n=1 Tax=Acidobacteriaceae TaxID=204434 RepID=UPI00131D7B2C|nr:MULTISPECIES: class I SAM-dependent methyltransferase [Acidobacteriaceae]MDW5265605.1 class I SAM-dependent methyltransferase [Edaphobacter sp.]
MRQRIFAWAFARFNHRYEQFVSAYKQRLFAGLSGTVIELGAGTGVNLRYLDRDRVSWIGVDPNPFMRPYLLREADRLGMAADCRIGTAYELPVEDESVDAVISTLVLCSIDDQQRALREVLRVLKPGGRFLFIEHVAAPVGSRLRRMQRLITPLWGQLCDGCHPNCETAAQIKHAGFTAVEYEEIVAPLPIVSPQIVGMARKMS